jgi:hypothetical protein
MKNYLLCGVSATAAVSHPRGIIQSTSICVNAASSLTGRSTQTDPITVRGTSRQKDLAKSYGSVDLADAEVKILALDGGVADKARTFAAMYGAQKIA